MHAMSQPCLLSRTCSKPHATAVCAVLHLTGAPHQCAVLLLQVHQLGGASFKCIIAAYKRQPQARPDTYKTGALRWPRCTLRGDVAGWRVWMAGPGAAWGSLH